MKAVLSIHAGLANSFVGVFLLLLTEPATGETMGVKRYIDGAE